MHRRTRVTLVACWALLALVLSGCAAGTGTAAGDRVVVDVWLAEYPFPGYLDPRERAAAAFNAEHPEYEVRVRAVEYTSLPGEVHRAAMEGRAPAAANYYYNAVQLARDAMAADGSPLFTSVEAAIGGRAEILGEPVVLDDLVAPARYHYADHGELTSMPLTMNTTMTYADQSVLEAAGIERVPTTWAELEQACAAIRALPDGPPHCMTWPNHSWFFQQALAQQGAVLADRGNGRDDRAGDVLADSPELMRFVSFWQRAAAAGDYLYTGAPNDFEGTIGAFAGRQVAFLMSTADQAGFLQGAAAAAGFPVSAGLLPVNGDAPHSGNLVTGDSLWLRAGLDRATEDGALAFMQYLNNADNAVDWHLSSNYLPMTYAAASRLQTQGHFTEQPAVTTAMTQIHRTDGSVAASGAVLGDFDGIQDALTTAMHDVLAAGADPVARFAVADADADALLAVYNAECTGADKSAEQCLRVGVWG